MTHISKKILGEETEKKLFKQFSKFFSEQDEFEIQSIFLDFLSIAEQKMFVNRLAVVIMLLEEHSTNDIAIILGVSDSTVREIKLKLKLGKYDSLIKRFKNKKFNTEAFIQIIESLLSAGLPSLGKDRWKSLR